MHNKKLPRTIWQYTPPEEHIVEEYQKKFDIPRFVADVLYQRNIRTMDDAQNFLNPNLSRLHDPYLMDDMNRAIARIRLALRNQEKILVCGDYDVDGITSVALLKQCFPSLGLEIFTYLPNRLEDGYGFHTIAVDRAIEVNASLLITVDCGITAYEPVEYANKNNIDVIITDHHEPNGPLPQAHAILNPKRENSQYPDKNLAGIGVAFKLVQALISQRLLDFPLPTILELVALGTVADVSTLIGENRILVHFGLETLAHTSHAGLRALMKVAGVAHGRKLDPFAIGFQLGPRLNAVGRLGSPNQALELLLTESPEKAKNLAQSLNSINQKRQSIEEEILQRVESEIANMDLNSDPFIIVSGEDWHEGVIGIVASKITDRYYRPSCVISIKDGIGKGSGRSIPCFSLFDCLGELHNELIEFGGHQIAAGFRVAAHNIQAFKEGCIRIAKEKLTPQDLIPRSVIDSVITLNDLDFSTIKALNRISPFGLGNPKPRFLINNLKTRYPPRLVGTDGNHIKLVLTDGRKTIDAIAFGFGRHFDSIRQARNLSVVATPEINYWNSREFIQLHVHDIGFN